MLSRKQNLEKNTPTTTKNPCQNSPTITTDLSFLPLQAINPIKNPSLCEFWYVSSIHHRWCGCLGQGWAAERAHAPLPGQEKRSPVSWWGAAISNSLLAQNIHAGAKLGGGSGTSLDPVSTGTSAQHLAVRLRCAWRCWGAVLKIYQQKWTEINGLKLLRLRLLWKIRLHVHLQCVWYPHMPLKIVTVQWDVSLTISLHSVHICIFNGLWQKIISLRGFFFLSLFPLPVETKLCPLTCACSVLSPGLDCHFLCKFRNAQLL